MSVNKAILIGRVGKEPEIRATQNGNKVANFSLATTSNWKDKDGVKQEKTEWHRVSTFNQALIPIIESYVKKGSKIYIEGQLQTRKWQDQTGKDCYTTEVVLQSFNGVLQLLDSKPDGVNQHSVEKGNAYVSDNSNEHDLNDEIPW